ncbi:SusC/RagA family TonB-linked outer membrane protein [Siphonobacter aquaeclarae]|uniref:TonB-linked outer membrane protein, SusC/RagA family n=1 Tax=Siphonobacter aquaeclarae TaxID=563176 RepID=A0A1G9QHH5_9BACT|nr:SusC/RagA family TonB-linked outer membrane protein [Siphonobacter aquaeclarae]SDM10498.1 TonB-linked outer membrane protein, SusC/RagA family [Siphonobacter aquaeclarae]
MLHLLLTSCRCKLLILCLLPMMAYSQDRILTGRVSDTKGQPLPGVTIQVKGTPRGTNTNASGEYRLSVSPGVTLIFSMIGTQTQEIELGSQTELNVTLENAVTSLDEVVVTGSTLTSSRRTLGNSIASIKSENLTKTGTNNLFGALQGKVAGAQITQNSGDPSGGISIRLRGVKSLQGNSDPLYVIDGVVVSNSSDNVSQIASATQAGTAATQGQNRMADINPNDIETINVINGAAAAAIYGSRASNGVVLITTKRGKSGKPRVTFSTSFNVNELRKKVFISTYGKQFGTADLRLHTIGAAPASAPASDVVSIVRDGTATNLYKNLVDVKRYDYQDDIFHTGYGTDNYLSISGGTEKTQYFASLSYLKNEGIIRGTDFKRYGLRLRLEQRLTDWAKVSLGLSYTNSFSHEMPNGNVFYSPINSVNITNNIYDISQRDAAGNLKAVEPTRINPLTVIETFKFTQAVNRTVNNFQLNLTPLKGLSVDWIVGVDAYSQLGKNFMPPYPYATEAGLPAERYPKGFAATANNLVFLINNDVNATYSRDLTDWLSLNATVGFNYQYQQKDQSVSTGQNLSPFIETVSGASTTITAGYDLNRFAISGQFAQATFGYKNQLFLTGAIRRDGSTIFSPSETNQLYPKVSGSWVVSDAGFWKQASLDNVFSSLKLRASYGDAGGLSALGTYDRFWQFAPTLFLGANTLVPNARLANSRVRPERMRELEFGGDLSFWSDRISLGLTFYKQKIKDLVVNRDLAPSQGGTSIIDNVGEMENKGVEVTLGIQPVKTKDFEWDVNFVYSRNRNKVTALGSPTVSISNVAGAPVFLAQGYAAPIFYGFYYARNPDGSLLLTPQGLPQRERGTAPAAGQLTGTPQRGADGQPTGTFLNKIIGNPNPKWTGSFSTSLTYKQFGLRVLLDAVQGFQIFNADKRTRNNVGIGDLAEAEMKGTAPRGTVFSLVNIEEYRVDDGSYTKLREVALSYSFPKLFKGLERMQLSLIGRNLHVWTKYPGYDPETNAGGNSDLLRGVDFGNVPIPRSYQVSLTANF